MRIAAKIAFCILTLTALGFCVAFVMEELVARLSLEQPKTAAMAATDSSEQSSDSKQVASGNSWKAGLAERAGNEADFADSVLAENSTTGALLLEATLGELDISVLEEHFIELMARDLDDYRAVAYAGRVLREISSRAPELGVTLLYAMTPAEKEKLVPSLTGGWVSNDPDSAFAWIESAWIDEEGEFIDRSLQNDLYIHAMDTMISTFKDYGYAASVLEKLTDPELKEELVTLVARRVVMDGPETALDRVASTDSELFDTSVMDAIAEEWATRDGVGAMNWTLGNQSEMSNVGVRSIAKQLVLNDEAQSLATFYNQLEDAPKRDTVASEAARLTARRNPVLSADWVLAIEKPDSKRDAVHGALYEIGYDNFSQSVDYIEYVYRPEDVDRAPMLYSTLKDWLKVDRESVVDYLLSERSQLSNELSEEILRTN